MFSSIEKYVDQIDFTKTSVKGSIVITSFLIWLGFYVASMLISSRFVMSYRVLKIKEKVFWHMTVIRAVFGVGSSAFGVWVIFFADDLHQDVALGTTSASSLMVLVALGFFLFEGLMVTITDLVLGNFQFFLNLHHWMAVAGFLGVTLTGSSHYFSCAALTLELSTPFSAACWTLLKCGLAHTKIWKVNQMMLLHTFHLRSVIECFLWIKTYNNWTTIVTNMPLSMRLIIYGELAIVTFLLTPYWTYKKTIQFAEPRDFNFDENARLNQLSNGDVKKLL